jgi:hypothetical protein
MSRKHALSEGVAVAASPSIPVEMSTHCHDWIFKQGGRWGALGTVREVICSVLGLRRTKEVFEEQ